MYDVRWSLVDAGQLSDKIDALEKQAKQTAGAFARPSTLLRYSVTGEKKLGGIIEAAKETIGVSSTPAQQLRMIIMGPPGSGACFEVEPVDCASWQPR